MHFVGCLEDKLEASSPIPSLVWPLLICVVHLLYQDEAVKYIVCVSVTRMVTKNYTWVGFSIISLILSFVSHY